MEAHRKCGGRKTTENKRETTARVSGSDSRKKEEEKGDVKQRESGRSWFAENKSFAVDCSLSRLDAPRNQLGLFVCKDPTKDGSINGPKRNGTRLGNQVPNRPEDKKRKELAFFPCSFAKTSAIA
jgi:hypothetical protein